MSNYLKLHYPGAHYRAVYEAGKFGFWIQRQLTALGIQCRVVNLVNIPNRRKIPFKKQILMMMPATSGCAFNPECSKVFIPDEQQEADRVFFRHRKRIWKDLTGCKIE